MNIVLAHDLYPQSLEGDEPEPLPQVRWPIADMMALLAEPDFREARNVSALFLSEAFCALRADTLRANKKGQISLALSIRTARGFHRPDRSTWCRYRAMGSPSAEFLR